MAKRKTKKASPPQANVIVARMVDGNVAVVTPLRHEVGRRLEAIQGLSMLRISMSHDHPLREKVGALLEEIADETAPLALAVFDRKMRRKVGQPT